MVVVMPLYPKRSWAIFIGGCDINPIHGIGCLKGLRPVSVPKLKQNTLYDPSSHTRFLVSIFTRAMPPAMANRMTKISIPASCCAWGAGDACGFGWTGMGFVDAEVADVGIVGSVGGGSSFSSVFCSVLPHSAHIR